MLAAEALDIVRFRPAVAVDAVVLIEVVDAFELRLERGSVTSVLAVLKVEVASLLVETLDTGLESAGVFGLIVLESAALREVLGLALRMVDATEGASDFGRSETMLLATLLLLEAVDGDGLPCGVGGDLETLEGVGETAEARDAVDGVRDVALVGVRWVLDIVDATEGATDGGRCTSRRVVLVEAEEETVLAGVLKVGIDGTTKLVGLCMSSGETTLARIEDVMLRDSLSLSRVDFIVVVARGVDTVGVGLNRSSTGTSNSVR